jgi:hypothetical protein
MPENKPPGRKQWDEREVYGKLTRSSMPVTLNMSSYLQRGQKIEQ